MLLRLEESMRQMKARILFPLAFALVHFVGVEVPVLAQNVDWRLHNLDLAGSRYAEIDQITPENAHSLTPRWLFQHGVIDGVSNQTTTHCC